MTTPSLPDPETLKQIIDYVGYTVSGLAAAITAWQRIRGAPLPKGGGRPLRKKKSPCRINAEVIEQIDREFRDLRMRQNDFQKKLMAQGEQIVKQQSAIFDLLVHQRNTLDRITKRTGGLE